jgi:hypothetical protein
MSGRLEVQGIVSTKTGEPLVQFRQIDNGNVAAEWQAGVADAREMAQQIVEAAMNATYDAALVAWVKEVWKDDGEERQLEVIGGLLTAVRLFRADTWGLPDQPEDWRT